MSRWRERLTRCALLVALTTGAGCSKRGETQVTPESSPERPPAVSHVTPPVAQAAQKSLAGIPGAGASTTPHVDQTPPAGDVIVSPPRRVVEHAIVVSVDGLAPRFLELLLQSGKAPTFAALQQRAAWTHDARTDKTYTITLPNHTCMLTGLPVSPSVKYGPHFAHNYVQNIDPSSSDTLHQYRLPAGSYTASMFDVTHDNGLRTAMFASKTKFALYEQTYNGAGAPDKVGDDNGPRKIDHVVIDVDPGSLVERFVHQLRTQPPALSFVHLNQPDGAGHTIGWGSPAYLAAVQQMDALLGAIVHAIDQPPLLGHTALLVTADHGGVDVHHGDETDIRNFQIPLYLLVPGVAAGDAYRAFDHRFAPGRENVGYEADRQPLRNGDVGNLALFLLGLGPVPKSVIHSAGLRVE